jgi:uncharacterized protein YjbJ (UPF0337 family)
MADPRKTTYLHFPNPCKHCQFCRRWVTGSRALLSQHADETRRIDHGERKSDELKGRVKEAAGVLTGDKKLKREGKADQAAGKIKQKVEKVIDKVKDALR